MNIKQQVMKVMLIANDNERNMVDDEISLSSPAFCRDSIIIKILITFIKHIDDCYMN